MRIEGATGEREGEGPSREGWEMGGKGTITDRGN